MFDRVLNTRVENVEIGLSCIQDDINHWRQPILLPWRLHGHQRPALATHTPEYSSRMTPSLTDFHTSTTKNYHPAPTVHQQEPKIPTPHLHLVASVKQIPSTCITPESRLLFSKHTSMQPVKMGPRNQQWQHNPSTHTPNLHYSLQKQKIGLLSLPSLFSNRRFTIPELKSKYIFSPPGK